MDKTTQETLQLTKEARQKALDAPELLAKAWTQGGATSGITAYDLESPAKLLYPVLTPLRNEIPRVGGGKGTATNWRAVTGVNTNNAGIGISEGNRGMVIAHTTSDNVASYRAIGYDDNVTFEADMAAEGFDDAKALAALSLLRSVMIGEEKALLGANNSVALGTVGTVTLSASASGGVLGTLTLSVICVALTLDAQLGSSVANGLPLSANRTLADGTVEAYNQGTSIKSANATVSVTGNTGSCGASVAVVTGACAYAWYWGTAGGEALGAITTINSVSITANAAGAQLASAGFAADKSQCQQLFDGLLYQIWKAGSGALITNMATGTPGTGTPLTADNSGGIVEIETDLKHFWDNYRLSPTKIWMNSQEMNNIGKKILAATSSSPGAQRFMFDAKQGMIAGGIVVKSYLNKFTMAGMAEIPIEIHPNLPAGTMLYDTRILPYPLSNVSHLLQVKTRRDYYQIEWPLRTRKYEYGVYADEVLQCYAPFAFGVRTNIGNG